MTLIQDEDRSSPSAAELCELTARLDRSATPLVVHVGDQLIVFPNTETQGPTCVAATGKGRRCPISVQYEGYGGWGSWSVPELNGKITALEPLNDANFLLQRCSKHVDSDSPNLLAPIWVPFSPEEHAALVKGSPKTVWTAEGLRTTRPEGKCREAETEEESLAALIAEAYANRTEPPNETALYRYYDAQDRLLYVGITDGLAVRIASHIKASSWMDFAARSTIERHPTRKAAADMEREAIEGERPLFNSVYNDHPVGRRRLVEYLIEHGRTDLLVADVSRG